MPYNFLKQKIESKSITPPEWMLENMSYMTYFGSIIYGTNIDMSDVDVYGFVVPPKTIVFPERFSEVIYGFDKDFETFDQWQEHHLFDNVRKREYDYSIFNIVKFVRLISENNPNVLESIFTKENHVIFADDVAKHLRKNRCNFLHKGSLNKFRNYSVSQMNKIKKQENSTNPTRAELIKKYSYDTKFAMHCVRLLLQAEQIATDRNLLLDKNSTLLKEIRQGAWTFEYLEEYMNSKLIQLEEYFSKSSLPSYEDTKISKKILMECLEIKFGTIDKMVVDINKEMLYDFKKMLDKYQS